MNYEKIFESIRRLEGIIACGIIDENGEILFCQVPENYPKDKLSKIYAVEVNIIRSLETFFGGFKYRIVVYGEEVKSMARIIYKTGEYFIVASSEKSPEIFQKQIETTLKESY